jgi:hypothetical protein
MEGAQAGPYGMGWRIWSVYPPEGDSSTPKHQQVQVIQQFAPGDCSADLAAEVERPHRNIVELTVKTGLDHPQPWSIPLTPAAAGDVRRVCWYIHGAHGSTWLAMSSVIGP